MAEYTIKLIERVVFLNERHNPVDGYRITFELTSGVIDWIDLPEAQCNDANVKAGIAKKVTLHASILK